MREIVDETVVKRFADVTTNCFKLEKNKLFNFFSIITTYYYTVETFTQFKFTYKTLFKRILKLT